MLLLFAVVEYIALVVLALLSDRIIFQPHPSSYRLSDLAASSSVQPLILASGQVNISAVCGRQQMQLPFSAKRFSARSRIRLPRTLARIRGIASKRKHFESVPKNQSAWLRRREEIVLIKKHGIALAVTRLTLNGGPLKQPT